MNKKKYNRKKLTDEQFFEVLRKNAGIFARTAKMIEKHYKVKYTRQSVRERALNNPDEYKDILEESTDFAESGLIDLMMSKNENVKFKAIELYLRTKGRERGYGDKIDLNFNNEAEKINLTSVPNSEKELKLYNALMKELANDN